MNLIILDIIPRILVLLCAFDWRVVFPIGDIGFSNPFNERIFNIGKYIFTGLYIASVLWLVIKARVPIEKDKSSIEKFSCDCQL